MPSHVRTIVVWNAGMRANAETGWKPPTGCRCHLIFVPTENSLRAATRANTQTKRNRFDMPDTQMKTTLAAVVYEAGTGGKTDQILCDIATELSDRGYQLAGTVQRAFERVDRCACDMVVRDLATGKELKISQDRGAHAVGCRLNPQSLEELVGSTETALFDGADVLIVNKFGKQEALGGGFRDVIARAVTDSIPTIVAVNVTYIEAWRAFAADTADELAPDTTAIEAWFQPRLPTLSTAGGRPSSLTADTRSSAL